MVSEDQSNQGVKHIRFSKVAGNIEHPERSAVPLRQKQTGVFKEDTTNSILDEFKDAKEFPELFKFYYSRLDVFWSSEYWSEKSMETVMSFNFATLAELANRNGSLPHIAQRYKGLPMFFETRHLIGMNHFTIPSHSVDLQRKWCIFFVEANLLYFEGIIKMLCLVSLLNRASIAKQ